MEQKHHKPNKYPQSGGRYSLEDYYLALKYRNMDTRMEELAWGIIHTIDRFKKSNRSICRGFCILDRWKIGTHRDINQHSKRIERCVHA